MSYSFDVYSFEINMDFLCQGISLVLLIFISFDRTLEILVSSSGPVLPYVVCQHEFICWMK